MIYLPYWPFSLLSFLLFFNQNKGGREASPRAAPLDPPLILSKKSVRVHLGRVVRKPVNVNPGLNVNCSITLSYLKMFFTSDVWCSLRLLQLKTEEQIT